MLINTDYLDLMSDGDTDMKKMMLEMMLEEIPAEIEKMNALIQEGNWKTLKEVSHKMKSTLSFVGNPEMTESNKIIEEIAKSEGAYDRLPTLIDSLLDLTPKVLKELKAELDSL